MLYRLGVLYTIYFILILLQNIDMTDNSIYLLIIYKTQYFVLKNPSFVFSYLRAFFILCCHDHNIIVYNTHTYAYVHLQC